MDSSAADQAGQEAEELINRIPARFRPLAERLLERWLGRFVLRMAAMTIRIEIFDRSMSVAAQFFTSVFPVLILLAVWVGSPSDELASALNMPTQAQQVLTDALDEGGSTTFGIVGALIVLVSATSLSRALTRAFAAIWELPRPKSKLTFAWRWVAVVMVLALTLVLVRTLTKLASEIPPSGLWTVVFTLAAYTAVGLFVPWVLLRGAVRIRMLLPGALIFGIVMTLARPASQLYLTRSLDSSAQRYGSIGVAFTYLAWLYAISFAFLAANAIGQILATDPAWFGRWIRGDRPLRVRDAGRSEPASR